MPYKSFYKVAAAAAASLNSIHDGKRSATGKGGEWGERAGYRQAF